MATSALDRWIRPAIRALSPYQVPESGGFVKLDAMENPYGWPHELIEAWIEVLKKVRLNRYPDAEAHGLKARLREYLRLPPNMDLLLGNGSDELIQMIGLTVTGPGHALLTPEPTFTMYRIIAEITGLRHVGIPLRPDDFSLDTETMLAAIERYQPALVILSYPNNPTGNLFDRKAVAKLIEASPGLVVIDEAYFNFSGETFINVLSHYRDLVVLRTLSKIGLAGLRVGILVGPQEWLAEINKVRLPYNINVLSQASCEFMLEHAEVLEEQAERIRADREVMYLRLKNLTGVKVWPSRTNFLLMRVPGRAYPLFDGLTNERILIKNLNGTHPLLNDCLRVTVGTPQENHLFLKALHKLLNQKI